MERSHTFWEVGSLDPDLIQHKT